METTLHRQLKEVYAGPSPRLEVSVDGFRIDAVDDGRLIEIQYGSLGAIRNKVARLVQRHSVLVVKPLAGRKYLVTRKRRRGAIVSARYSPLRQSYFDLFDDLVHFVDVFPHPRLTLEALLTEQEEHRLPVRRGRRKKYRVEDRRLRSIDGRLTLRTAEDLFDMLPASLVQSTDPFSTEDIAREAGIPRWVAQKLAYCLRKTGGAATVGKRGNAWLYRPAAPDTCRRPRQPNAASSFQR